MKATLPSCCAPYVERVTCFLQRPVCPMFESLRTRLTLWYVGILAAVLLAFSSGVYTLVERTLYAHQDARLQSALDVSTDAVSKSGQGARSIVEGLQKVGLPN